MAVPNQERLIEHLEHTNVALATAVMKLWKRHKHRLRVNYFTRLVAVKSRNAIRKRPAKLASADAVRQALTHTVGDSKL